MTKIYEALENAGKERSGGAASGSSLLSGASAVPRFLEEKLITLHQHVVSLLENRVKEGGTIVLIAGVSAGDESSRLVSAYAKSVVKNMGRKILLVSIGDLRAARALYPDQNAADLADLAHGDVALEEAVRQVGHSSLYVAQIGEVTGGLLDDKNSPLALTLRENFDVILIDAPSLSKSMDGIRMAPAADGVVLVVEANSTRWQVVRHRMEQIEAQKGEILGVILNKQRHYIPNWVYRKFL